MNYPAIGTSNVSEIVLLNHAGAIAEEPVPQIEGVTPHSYPLTVGWDTQVDCVQALATEEKLEGIAPAAILSGLRHWLDSQLEDLLDPEFLQRELKDCNSTLHESIERAHLRLQR